MPTAKKTPSGKWKTFIYSHTDENGKKHFKSFTADTKKESERLALEYKYVKETNKITFEKKMDEYLEINNSVLSPSTLRSYTSMSKMLKKNYPKFCNKVNIEKDDVQNLINELAKTHKPKSVKNYNGFISVILGDSSHFKITLPQTIKHTYRIPNKAEFKLLLDTVKDSELEIPVLLGSFCMMRRSEICGLKIDDIENNIIHIHNSVVKGADNAYVEKTTKTVSSDRYIQAPDFVIEKIMKQGYVTNMTPAAISDAFRKIIFKLEFTGMRFHDLRHWGASYRHSVLNIPTAHIQKDGGWSNPYTLEQIYRHALDDEHKRYSDQINKAFESEFIS